MTISRIERCRRVSMILLSNLVCLAEPAVRAPVSKSCRWPHPQDSHTPLRQYRWTIVPPNPASMLAALAPVELWASGEGPSRLHIGRPSPTQSLAVARMVYALLALSHDDSVRIKDPLAHCAL